MPPPRLSSNVLAVGLAAAVAHRVQSTLGEHGWLCEVVSSALEAADLALQLRYDALVLACPLGDMNLHRFVGLVRRTESPCRRAGLVLLAEADHMSQAAELVGMGVNRVLVLEESSVHLPAVLEGLTRPEPRVPLQALVKLVIETPGGPLRVLCQTVNVSRSGMLVRLDERIPVGTEIPFELNLPGLAAPLSGVARVVRHAVPRHERLRGIGLRFAPLPEQAAALLAQQVAAADGYPPPRERASRSWPA